MSQLCKHDNFFHCCEYLRVRKSEILIVVTFRLLDLEIDIGQVLGAVGGLLFSTRNEANTTKPNEDAPEGKLGLKLGFNEGLF